MFFKNATYYSLGSMGITTEQLHEKLAARPFMPCGASDMETRGWVSPTGDDRMALDVNGHVLICLMIERKLLPGPVVNEQAAEKAKLIEQQQGYKVGRKQLKEIKEFVAVELMAKAFTRKRKLFAWIDTNNLRLVIDTPSDRHAEDVLNALRDSLDVFPVKMLRTALSPVSVMTAWLAAGEASGAFTIDRDCKLSAVTDERATVRYTHHELDGKDVQDHLAAGKLPETLGLTFDDRVSFVLTEKGKLNRLAFLDAIKEEVAQKAESQDMQAEADFAIMSGELSRVLDGVIAALGGIQHDPIF